MEPDPIVLPQIDAQGPFVDDAWTIDKLIEQPLTVADLMHNSIVYEFNYYAWRQYAHALIGYIDKVNEIVSGEEPT